MKESVAIHLALQPIAAYAYNAVSACKILIKTHETSREQAEFGILLTGMCNAVYYFESS
jgi:hypothetical protein